MPWKEPEQSLNQHKSVLLTLSKPKLCRSWTANTKYITLSEKNYDDGNNSVTTCLLDLSGRLVSISISEFSYAQDYMKPHRFDIQVLYASTFFLVNIFLTGLLAWNQMSVATQVIHMYNWTEHVEKRRCTKDGETRNQLISLSDLIALIQPKKSMKNWRFIVFIFEGGVCERTDKNHTWATPDGVWVSCFFFIVTDVCWWCHINRPTRNIFTEKNISAFNTHYSMRVQ